MEDIFGCDLRRVTLASGDRDQSASSKVRGDNPHNQELSPSILSMVAMLRNSALSEGIVTDIW